MGQGWEDWNIAAFAAYLACFTRLAVKSSHAAHLFNALQKADVSWHRIRDFLTPLSETALPPAKPDRLTVSHVSFTYPGASHAVIQDCTFSAAPSDIIGITGGTASGKSTLGRLFLMESPHEGSITWGKKELGRDISPLSLIGYMGHSMELFNASLEENIGLGKKGNLDEALWGACLDEEAAAFPRGVKTVIGEGGIRLSGGQQARVMIARLLYHRRPLIILDDPFASVDRETEDQLFDRIHALCPDSIILLISHRLRTFPKTSQVLWIGKDGRVTTSTHEKLLAENEDYRRLWALQNPEMHESHCEERR